MRNTNEICLNIAFIKAKINNNFQKIIKMEKKNQKFQELVKKMETLKETEKGKLKGGFMTITVQELKDPTNGTGYVTLI